jgi:hypothetical protein
MSEENTLTIDPLPLRQLEKKIKWKTDYHKNFALLQCDVYTGDYIVHKVTIPGDCDL